MKRRDKRKRRKKRLAHRLVATRSVEPTGTVKVIRDSRGRPYINAPDGSLRRVDKVKPEKLDWMSEGGRDVEQ